MIKKILFICIHILRLLLQETPTKLDICKHMILIIDSIAYTCKWISKLNSVHVPYMKYSLGEGG